MADMDAPVGRGSQVIKVVMPTYIMAPTEDERCVLQLPHYRSLCLHRTRTHVPHTLMYDCLCA